MAKIRVFLADDHAVVRAGLRSLIAAQADMEVVGEAADGRVVELAMQTSPDVVVVDVSMPVANGARATEDLRASCPGVRVLALTIHEDKAYIRQLLAAGASGYVLKRAAAEELIHAIRIVAAGGVYIDPSLAGKVVGSFVGRPPTKGVLEGRELSEREEEVFRLVARGLTNKEIAARFEISVKTVETYKARSMEKLGLANRAEAVQYALRRGWLADS